MKIETKETLKVTSILLLIPATVVGINIIGFLMGGIIGSAVMGGVVFSISFVFILLNMGMDKLIKVRNYAASHSGYIDLVQTLVLTYIGFHIGGVTIAMALMVLGLNISAVLSGFRLWAVLTDKSQRVLFNKEFNYA